MKRRSTLTPESARRALVVAGILGLMMLTLCSKPNVFAGFHTMNHVKSDDNVIGAFHHLKLAAHAASERGLAAARRSSSSKPSLEDIECTR